MKNKKTKLFTTLLLGLGFSGIHAQEAVPAAGGEASGTGGSVSYSIGQLVYSTNAGTSGSVAQGVQQPFEISAVGIQEANQITLECLVYPIPTTDFLLLKFENSPGTSLNYQLYDLTGKILENKKIKNRETRIEMCNMAPATYFLSLSDNQNKIKIFKIIKN